LSLVCLSIYSCYGKTENKSFGRHGSLWPVLKKDEIKSETARKSLVVITKPAATCVTWSDQPMIFSLCRGFCKYYARFGKYILRIFVISLSSMEYEICPI